MTVPRLRPGVRLHHDKVRARWVLLAPERIMALDETAHAILEQVDGTRSVCAIAQKLSAEYDADITDIETDASTLLRDLNAQGYIAL